MVAMGMDVLAEAAAANAAAMGSEAAAAGAVEAAASAEAAAGTVHEGLLSIDALREKSETLAKRLAADKAWIAAEKPADMGHDLLVATGVTTFDQVRASRRYAEQHGLAA